MLTEDVRKTFFAHLPCPSRRLSVPRCRDAGECSQAVTAINQARVRKSVLEAGTDLT
jgi:hypothetical protein